MIVNFLLDFYSGGKNHEHCGHAARPLAVWVNTERCPFVTLWFYATGSLQLVTGDTVIIRSHLFEKNVFVFIVMKQELISLI